MILTSIDCLIQVVNLCILGRTSDFLLYPSHFSYYDRRFLILFNLLFQVVTLLDIVYECSPTFVGFSSNANLVYRALAMLFWPASFFLVVLGLTLCWCHLHGQKHIPGLPCMTSQLGGGQGGRTTELGLH